MVISSVVVHLITDPDATLRQLREHPKIEVGPPQGNRWPLVLETADATSGKQLFRWLQDLPGIDHVDVVYVHEDTAAGVA